jgi:hypothetical protein
VGALLSTFASGQKTSLSFMALGVLLAQAVACGGDENGAPGENADGGTGGSASGASGAGGTSGTAGSGGTSAAGSSGAASGGASSSGGTATGGTATGGTATGGTATGGTGAGGTTGGVGGSGNAGSGAQGGGGSSGTGTGGSAGSSGGAAGKGGSGASAGSSGATSGNREVFPNCRFHFGTIDSKATGGGSSLISQLDFFTPGWMLSEAFDQRYVCDATKSGGALEGKVPIVVAYLAAGIVKRRHNICDCNVTTCGSGNDLCRQGAALIKQDKQTILNAYRSFSQGYAGCYGTTKPIVFAMEPDFYQYTTSSQTAPWTPAEAGQIMTEFVTALKSSLPNARFSIDASPWVAPNNGGDHGATWFQNFDMTLFSFVNTSGGGTNANTAKIRNANNMTWAGLRQASGKPILADTGYGANGVSAGEDPNWNVAANVNARIADGVISISQYNPSSGWAGTISSLRPQLSATSTCP